MLFVWRERRQLKCLHVVWLAGPAPHSSSSFVFICVTCGWPPVWRRCVRSQDRQIARSFWAGPPATLWPRSKMQKPKRDGGTSCHSEYTHPSCVCFVLCFCVVVFIHCSYWIVLSLSLSVNLSLSHLFAFFLSYSCSRSLFFPSFSSFFLFSFLVEVEHSSTVVSDYMVIYIFFGGYSTWGIVLHCSSPLFLFCSSNGTVYLHITPYLLSIEVYIMRDQFLACEMSRDAKCRNKMIASAAEFFFLK